MLCSPSRTTGAGTKGSLPAVPAEGLTLAGANGARPAANSGPSVGVAVPVRCVCTWEASGSVPRSTIRMRRVGRTGRKTGASDSCTDAGGPFITLVHPATLTAAANAESGAGGAEAATAANCNGCSIGIEACAMSRNALSLNRLAGWEPGAPTACGSAPAGELTAGGCRVPRG